MSKVTKEFGARIGVTYPNKKYPQDLIDSQVMPALRRSYDRARRENWRMAQATSGTFEMLTGPVEEVWDEDEVFYIHQFGWYVRCEIEEEEEDAVPEIPRTQG